MENNQINITIGIKDIKVQSFELSDYANGLTQIISQEQIEFDYNLMSRINYSAKEFDCTLNVTIRERESRTELATLECLVSFNIENFNEVIIQKDQKLDIPQALAQNAMSICVGTARGMLTVLTKDTNLSRAIIPPFIPPLLAPTE